MYGTRFAGNRMAGGGGSHVIYGVYGGGASGFRVARGPTSRVLPELRVLVVAVMEVPEVLARLPLPVLRRPVRVVGAGRRRRRRRIPDAVARRRRPVQRRRADAVRRAGRGRVFAPLDRVRVVPGAAPPERKVPLARHLVLFLPLHPTVSVYRVHRAPVPRRFHGAQEFLPAKNHKKTNIKLNPTVFTIRTGRAGYSTSCIQNKREVVCAGRVDRMRNDERTSGSVRTIACFLNYSFSCRCFPRCFASLRPSMARGFALQA